VREIGKLVLPWRVETGVGTRGGTLWPDSGEKGMLLKEGGDLSGLEVRALVEISGSRNRNKREGDHKDVVQQI